MDGSDPKGALDSTYSSPGAQAITWSEAVAVVRASETFWLTTVRPDGRPHTVPLLGVWVAPAWYFVTGPAERKVANLATNPACTVTTGLPLLDGMDVVIEGQAELVPVEQHDEREAVAQALEAKDPMHVASGAMFEELPGYVRHADAQVYRVEPKVAFAFLKGQVSAQIRWRF